MIAFDAATVLSSSVARDCFEQVCCLANAMESNPYQPPRENSEGIPAPKSEGMSESPLDDPVPAYVADGNLESHIVVRWLEANGVPAHAVEDHSGVSLFALGTISQFHKPQVFVNRSDLERAAELLQEFEDQRNLRRKGTSDAAPIMSECEECGATSEFPALQNGTTQTCPQCHAYMDVGTSDWPEDFDFGEPEDDSEPD